MRLDKRTIRAMSMVSGLGFSIALCLGGGILLGVWLDDRLHTRPVMILIGIFVGLACSAMIFYSLATPRKRHPDDERGDDDGNGSA